MAPTAAPPSAPAWQPNGAVASARRRGHIPLMALSQLEAQLGRFLATAANDGVVAAYLFGSEARDEARQRSDVDLAILFAELPPATLTHPAIRLGGELERQLGRPVDIVVLNTAPVDLVHRVLRDGRLLLDHDPSRRIQFEIKSRNNYFDLLPVMARYRGRPGADV